MGTIWVNDRTLVKRERLRGVLKKQREVMRQRCKRVGVEFNSLGLRNEDDNETIKFGDNWRRIEISERRRTEGYRGVLRILKQLKTQFMSNINENKEKLDI